MHKRLSILLFPIIAIVCIVGSASAVVEVAEFKSTEEEARYKALIAELRCPKCQNQNLHDSDAPIAADLRRKTRTLIDQGKSNEEVKSYMLERYGDFVLYKPRFTLATAFLWIGPFVLLGLVILFLVKRIKHNQEEELLKPSHSEDESVRIKVRNLMSNTPALDSDQTTSPNKDRGQ